MLVVSFARRSRSKLLGQVLHHCGSGPLTLFKGVSASLSHTLLLDRGVMIDWLTRRSAPYACRSASLAAANKRTGYYKFQTKTLCVKPATSRHCFVLPAPAAKKERRHA